MTDKKIALVDNDFISRVAEIHRAGEEVVALFQRVLDGLSLTAKMHIMIYENEYRLLHGDTFFNEGVILNKVVIKTRFRKVRSWFD